MFAIPRILRFVSANDRKKIITFQKLARSLISVSFVNFDYMIIDIAVMQCTHVKKKEQPRTWLCTKPSAVFS